MKHSKLILALLSLSVLVSTLGAAEDKPINYDKLDFIPNTSWAMVANSSSNMDTYYNMDQVYKIVFDDSKNVATLYFENSESVLSVYIGKINPKQKLNELLGKLTKP